MQKRIYKYIFSFNKEYIFTLKEKRKRERKNKNREIMTAMKKQETKKSEWQKNEATSFVQIVFCKRPV